MRRPRFIPPLGPPELDARQRALADWRGADLSAAEKARADAAQSAAALVPKVVAGLRLEQRLTETEIQKAWDHLVSPAIGAHARPTGLHNGTLFVAVDNSVWLEEIVRYHRREILLRLQNSFGRKMIKKVSFRIG